MSITYLESVVSCKPGLVVNVNRNSYVVQEGGIIAVGDQADVKKLVQGAWRLCPGNFRMPNSKEVPLSPPVVPEQPSIIPDLPLMLPMLPNPKSAVPLADIAEKVGALKSVAEKAAEEHKKATDSLEVMTMPELKSLADKNGLAYYKTIKKSALIEALREVLR